MEDLRRILAAPADDAPRLAYAAQCGDPARAEMIRLQCAVANASPRDPGRQAMHNRAYALIEANFQRWFDDVARVVDPGDIWRGFVASATGSVSELADHADALAKVAVEMTLNIEDPDDDVQALADHVLLERVRRLEFGEDATSRNVVARLLRAPRLTGVRSVTFVDDQHAAETVRAIDGHLPNTVRALNFAGYRVTTFNDAVAAELCRSPRVAQLEHLALYNCNLRKAGAQAIGNGTFRGLETLYLGLGNHTANSVGAEGIEALASLTRLRTLDLDFNSIGDKGVRALHRFRNVESLHLQANGITDKGIAALCDSPLLHQLTVLDLRHNRITSKGLACLVTAAPRRLRRLWIDDNRGAKMLAATVWARQLDELHPG
jgi:uncharacterized protein (TIGR02996 family)